MKIMKKNSRKLFMNSQMINKEMKKINKNMKCFIKEIKKSQILLIILKKIETRKLIN